MPLDLIDEIKGELALGKLIFTVERKARARGMTTVEYVTWLTEKDVLYVPLKTFAKRYKGSLTEFAVSLNVSKVTISKWRSGEVMKCNKLTCKAILDKYGVVVESANY